VGISSELVTAIRTRDWSDVVHRSSPADPWQLASVRKQVRSWLTPLGLTASLREDLVYAVSEAVDNAVERAQDAAGDCYTINVIFSTEIGNEWVRLAQSRRISLPDSERSRSPPETAPSVPPLVTAFGVSGDGEGCRGEHGQGDVSAPGVEAANLTSPTRRAGDSGAGQQDA
jgi:anti-sigma regulatory factor (Ser/Thr protein kinase)